MLLVGGTCFAQQQEEFQKDSVWGLEWNLQDSILTVSFMSSCDGFWAVILTSYTGGVYKETNTGADLHEGLIVMPSGASSYMNDAHDIIHSSMNVDTISAYLTKYTLSVILDSEYLTIPQNLSTYHGYFGVTLQGPGHDRTDVYGPYKDDLTKCKQFLYFNLLNSLSWNKDYRSSSTLNDEMYYSLAGIPLKEMRENEPIVVIMKSADNRIVNSKIRIYRP